MGKLPSHLFNPCGTRLAEKRRTIGIRHTRCRNLQGHIFRWVQLRRCLLNLAGTIELLAPARLRQAANE